MITGTGIKFAVVNLKLFEAKGSGKFGLFSNFALLSTTKPKHSFLCFS